MERIKKLVQTIVPIERKKGQQNCIPVALTAVDALLSNTKYRGQPIPPTKDIEFIRTMKQAAWLEHRLLSRENFFFIPPSSDPEIAFSQEKGVPVFRNEAKGDATCLHDIW